MKALKSFAFALVALGFLAGAAQAKVVQPEKGSALIDLNLASVEELAELPYIGIKRAQLIVARRSEQPFKTIEGLKEVKGIGDKTFEKIRHHVRVGSVAPKSP